MTFDALIHQFLSSKAWVITLAFLYAAVIAHFPIAWVVGKMWKLAEIETLRNHTVFEWETGPLGMIERILYVVALGMQRPEFIGVWLTLKTISRSPRWEISPGRHIFNIFLVGNGLSILYALAAAGMVKLLAGYSWERDYFLAYGGPVVLLIATGILIGYLHLTLTKKRKRRETLVVKLDARQGE